MKKYKDFIKENKDITLLSLGWSLYWRVALVIVGITFFISFISAL